MSEILKQARELLSGLVTADNTEVIANISKSFDEVEQKFGAIEKENVELKDKIVDMVKTTIVSKVAPEDQNKPAIPQEFDMDKALNGAINEVVKARKDK